MMLTKKMNSSMTMTTIKMTQYEIIFDQLKELKEKYINQKYIPLNMFVLMIDLESQLRRKKFTN